MTTVPCAWLPLMELPTTVPTVDPIILPTIAVPIPEPDDCSVVCTTVVVGMEVVVVVDDGVLGLVVLCVLEELCAVGGVVDLIVVVG